MFKMLKQFLSKKHEPAKPQEWIYHEPPDVRVCGLQHMIEREKRFNLSSKNNQVKPTFRKYKPLFFKGKRIANFQHQVDGQGFTITLGSGKKLRLSNKEWLLNVDEKPGN